MKRVYILLLISLPIMGIAYAAGTIIPDPAELDPTFGQDGRVISQAADNSIVHALIHAGGRTIAGGEFQSANSRKMKLFGLTYNGDLDTSFGVNGLAPVPTNPNYPDFSSRFKKVTALVLDSNNSKILAAVQYHNGSNHDFALLRYNSADGTLDATFHNGGYVITPGAGGSEDIPYGIALDGSEILVVGQTSFNNNSFLMVRYNSNGNVLRKTAIKIGGTGRHTAYDVAVLSNRKVILVGEVVQLGISKYVITRLNHDDNNPIVNDEIDTSFGPNGRVFLTTTEFPQLDGSAVARAVITGANDKIYVGGYARRSGSSGMMQENVFVMSSKSTDFVLSRLSANGSFDWVTPVSFGSGYNDKAYDMDIDFDGHILLAGTSSSTSTRALNPTGRFVMSRHDMGTGALDTSFGAGGKVITTFTEGSSTAYTIDSVSSLITYLGGYVFDSAAQTKRFAIARYGGTMSAYADVAINITVDRIPPYYEVGDPVNYTMTITNNGPNSATGVHVTVDEMGDPITSSITFDCSVPPTMVCEADIATPILTGQSETITFTRILANVPGNALNTATVSANETDPYLNNNTDTVNYEVGAGQEFVTSECPDGIVEGLEQCDDANYVNGDGCSTGCQIEPGWICSGEPSVCTTTCGDGVMAGAEECDDGNTVDGDGCSNACQIESGWSCSGEPSVCTTGCGDGIIAGAEGCDDGNTINNDGCSDTCQIEAGWSCNGEPSECTTTCGDGVIAGAEECDDENTVDGDGCSYTCQIEAGWSCSGSPSVCTTTCGDGVIAGLEECDDGNTVGGDGCRSDCTTEPPPSPIVEGSSEPTCGDGSCNGVETCSSCRADCGVCPVVCEDGVCDSTENCTSCYVDCGACPPGCGDGTCDNTEDCTTCSVDCGACPPECGDGTCDSAETCSTCSADCGACSPLVIEPPVITEVPTIDTSPPEPAQATELERLDIEGGGGCSLIRAASH